MRGSVKSAGRASSRAPARAPQPTVSSLLAALPDLVLGALFLLTWVAPTAIREKMVAYLVLLMLLEFIIVHSSAFMGSVMVSAADRRKKSLAILGLGAFYTLFVGGFAIAFKALWLLWNFWGLTLNRLLGVLIGQAPAGNEKEFVMRGWAVSTMCYLLFAFATTLLPFPALGVTHEIAQRQALPGDGLWIDAPHRAIAFGFLYFTTVGVSELFHHAWLPAGTQGAARSGGTAE